MDNEEKILKLLSELNLKFDNIHTDMKSMKDDISLIKTQLKEHGETLSSLKTASEFHKADIDNLTHQTANISGDVKTIKTAVVKGEKAYNFLQNFNNFSTSE